MKLFFPPSVFFTPDFGRSDILHSNLPAKYILSTSFKNKTLPLWENKIGQGFPITSEGIIGTFYLQNLLIFSIFPFKIAIPLNYLVTFTIAALGMYLLLQKLNADKYASILGAVSYTFCASMMLHVQHINFIQSASLLPIILLFIINFLEKPKIAKGFLISFLFSQLFFAGFIQIFTYAVIIFFIFIFFYNTYVVKKRLIRTIFSCLLIILFSLSLSAVQLLPSYELIKESDRQEGVEPSKILDAFPLFPRNFQSYLNPSILGNASNGTYNSNDWKKNGIYWENTAYIGKIPLFLAIASIILILMKRPKNAYSPITITLIITILLSLGRFSPTHIFFSFPPLNFFRVPSRFILFTQLFAVLLSVYFLKNLNMKKTIQNIIITCLITITFADIWINWQNYNPTFSADDLFKDPQIIKSLKDKDNFRIFSIGAPKNWNQIFLESGWKGKEPYYYFFRNAQDQNLNLLYNTTQFAMFETLPTRRYQLQQSIIKNNIKVENNTLKIESLAKKNLDFANVKYLITTSPVEGEYEQIAKLEKGDLFYFVYESQSTAHKLNFFYDFQIASTVGDYPRLMGDNSLQKTLILEKDPNLVMDDAQNSITTQEDKNGYLRLSAQTQKTGLLANSQSFYPGWIAKIDGVETEIYAANINSQAIIVPEGSHTVEFIYKPVSFKIGLTISLISFLILIVIGAKSLKVLQ